MGSLAGGREGGRGKDDKERKKRIGGMVMKGDKERKKRIGGWV